MEVARNVAVFYTLIAIVNNRDYAKENLRDCN